MSVIYTVRLKDPSREAELNYKKLIGEYGFGVFRNDRLEEGYPEEDDDLVIYDKNRIGRGVSVGLNEDGDGFELHMPMPAIREDIDLLFELIERLADQMGECIINDEDSEEVIAPHKISDTKDELERGNRSALVSFMKNYKLADDDYLTFYCAKYPLQFNRDMCEKVASSDDPLKMFGEIIHRCQSTKAKMIAPDFYNTPQGITGVYNVEGGRQIVPLKPSVPFGLCGEDGKQIKVERWFAVYTTADDVWKAADYDSFVSAAKEHSEFFDGGCVLADELSAEKIGEIFTGGEDMIFGE